MSSPKQHRQVSGHWGIFGRVRRGKQRTYRHGAEVQKEKVRLFTRVQEMGCKCGWRRDLLFDFFCMFRKIRLYQPSKVCKLRWKVLPKHSFFLFSRRISPFFANCLNSKDEPCAWFRETCLHAQLFSCSWSSQGTLWDWTQRMQISKSAWYPTGVMEELQRPIVNLETPE